jgi:hypothetical protein
MNTWDDLLGRLTRRLEVDEELRLDVARELATHLEDSAAEFRAAEMSEEQAAASAAKALGDENELAEQLWQANRQRIRVRGLLRWTARVTLAPVAMVIVLVLFTYLVGVTGFLRGLTWNEGSWIPDRGSGWPMGPLGRLVCDPYLGAGLSEEQQFLLQGDPNAKTPLERAKSISDRWPDNPVYYANYITTLLVQQKPIQNKPGETPSVDEEKLSQALAALRHGERLDPDNGFYSLEVASLLVQASSKLEEAPSATYDKLTRDGKVMPVAIDRIVVTDPERFRRGLEEFRRGLGKPRLTSYPVKMAKVRLDVLPVPRRLIQYLDRLSICCSIMLPSLGDQRQLSKSLLAYSRVLAHQGQTDEAGRIQRGVERQAIRLGAQTDTLIGLLVAQAIRQHGLGYEEVIHRELGQSQAAETSRRQRMENDEFFNGLIEFFNGLMSNRRLKETRYRQLGLLESVLLPDLPGYKVDLKPVRTAEHFIFAQAGLFVLLAVLVLAAVALSMGTLLELVIIPKSEQPVLLFVGWRRLGKICLLGVVVPVAFYACYALAMATWGPSIGLAGAWDRVCVEFLALGCVVLFLLVRFSRTAIAQRAAELGMGAPPRPYRRGHPWRAAALVILGMGVAYVIGWWAGPFRLMGPGNGSDKLMILFTIVGLALAAVGVIWVVWSVVRAKSIRKAGPEARRFDRTLNRSLASILAATVIVVGIALGGLLAVGEGYAISQMGKGMPMPDEIKNSDFRLLQERFVQMDEQMTGQTSGNAAERPR